MKKSSVMTLSANRDKNRELWLLNLVEQQKGIIQQLKTQIEELKQANQDLQNQLQQRITQLPAQEQAAHKSKKILSTHINKNPTPNISVQISSHQLLFPFHHS